MSSFDSEFFKDHPPSQYDEWATDPYTGLKIPKSLAANLAWRKTMLAGAKSSASVRRAIKAASVKSPIYWLNLVGWTFQVKRVFDDGQERPVQGAASHVPFITWKVQDRGIVELVNAIDGGYDALIHKSRDMGASWLVLAVFQWYFQFRPSTTFMELSRKEILVDKRGDMDSLFEKHRYLMRWQPEWLRPQRLVDNSLHLENKDIGTTIEGESTTENAGQASRKTAMLLDEFARVKEGEEVDLATADTSSCRIFNSTPQGPNTHFTRIYRDMVTKRRAGKLIVLPWWDHPLKGKDVKIEAITDLVKADKIGVQVGETYPMTKWIDFEIQRRSKRNFAQNIRGEHGRSGDNFFDVNELERHKKIHVRPPSAMGDIVPLNEVTEEEKGRIIAKRAAEALAFTQNPTHQPWRLWMPLVNGRPDQATQYVFGVDISNGSGASNSVISAYDHKTQMIVAKFWDAFTSPESLADIVAYASIWFGGQRPPLVIFEKNGPGVIFGRKLVNQLRYPNIYYQEVVDQKSKQTLLKWGWHSSPTKKEILLGAYREALSLNQIINPCEESLNEAADYVYDEKGKIEPGTVGAETGGGSSLHGDHVIADALCNMGRMKLPSVFVPTTPPVAYFSPGWRKRQRKNANSDKFAWSA